MIKSKIDYNFYLEADKLALGISEKWQDLLLAYFLNDIWQFQRILRKTEYYTNCKRSILWKPYILYLRFRTMYLGRKLGFEIPPNVFGPGLGIAHRGTLIVNPNVRVGENCRIHSCTYLATQATGKSNDCPIIGNNVFIGPCTVIVGKIEIADDVAIGANSYVSNSFSEKGITIAGAPAVKVSNKGSHGLCSTQLASDIIKGRRDSSQDGQ